MNVKSGLKVGSITRIALVILALAGLASSTRRYGTFADYGSAETTEQSGDVTSEKYPGDEASIDFWQMIADIGRRWLPLSLPFLVGLGILEVVLFHTTIFYIIGTLKNQPEHWGRSRLSAAITMGVAWGVQMTLTVGLLAIGLRVGSMIKDGSFFEATAFSAFCPFSDQLPLMSIMYATLIVTVCYWIMLTILWRVEEKKKSRREEMEGMLVKESMDLNSLPVTKL